MRVKQISENRIYWCLGRGQGDQVLGVEVFAAGGKIFRTLFSRGKFGREVKIAMEEYSAEEYMEIIHAERSLIPSKANEGTKELLLCALEAIRRAYNGL